MDSSEIKGLMKKLGVSQEDIARKLGITRVYVNRVINGERSTKRVRQAISDAVGKPYEEVWGDEDQPFLIPEDYQREIKRLSLLRSFYEKRGDCLKGLIGRLSPLLLPLRNSGRGGLRFNG